MAVDDMATAPPMRIAGTGARSKIRIVIKDTVIVVTATCTAPRPNMLPEPYELLEREFQAKREQQEYNSDLANAAQGSVLGKQAEAGRSDDYAGKNVTDNAGHADP
ncbi:hypothetical protein AQY21_19935 [Paracoccus sp. MKU1]|nr:hypothetical protein AQY21_19935 [Paracoccus sp. MKU1]